MNYHQLKMQLKAQSQMTPLLGPFYVLPIWLASPPHIAPFPLEIRGLFAP